MPRLLNDPSIVLAVEAIKSRARKFHQSRTDGQVYVARNGGSKLRVRFKNGQPKVLNGDGLQGSEVWDTEDYIQHRLRPELKKAGLSEEKIGESIDTFRRLPVGILLPLPHGFSVIKHSLPGDMMPEMAKSKLVDPRMIALLAYEWLAISCAGNQILGEPFSAIREFITQPEPAFQPDYEYDGLEINRLGGNTCSPAHDLYTISRKDGLLQKGTARLQGRPGSRRGSCCHVVASS